jgi:hypothetical protein
MAAAGDGLYKHLLRCAVSQKGPLIEHPQKFVDKVGRGFYRKVNIVHKARSLPAREQCRGYVNDSK